MRRSSVVLLLLCAVSPSRSAAQVWADIEGPSPGPALLQVDGGNYEATAIGAAGYDIGVDASGGVHGARIAGGIHLVAGTGQGWGPSESGTLQVDVDGTLWYRVVGGENEQWIALNRQKPPPGSISAFAGVTEPTGYLFCNGQAVSRTTYAALFAAIGTTYGAGDGTTTFNIPDLRGEFIRGLDAGRGVDAGRALGSRQSDAFQGHWHYLGKAGNPTYFSGEGQISTPNNYAGLYADNDGTKPRATTAVADESGNGTPRTSSETRPRNVAVNFIIAH